MGLAQAYLVAMPVAVAGQAHLAAERALAHAHRQPSEALLYGQEISHCLASFLDGAGGRHGPAMVAISESNTWMPNRMANTTAAQLGTIITNPVVVVQSITLPHSSLVLGGRLRFQEALENPETPARFHPAPRTGSCGARGNSDSHLDPAFCDGPAALLDAPPA